MIRRCSVTVLIASSLFSLAPACESPADQNLQITDLAGTWVGVTLGETPLSLVLGQSAIELSYELRVADSTGEFQDILEDDSDLLVLGRWSVLGRVLSLGDESGPLVCAAGPLRFEVTMSMAMTKMSLLSLDDACTLNRELLQSRPWSLRTEE